MSVVAAERQEDLIAVTSEFRDRDLIRLVPGASWNGDTRKWEVPLSWASCRVLRGVFYERLQIGPALTEWAWSHRTNIVEPAMRLRDASTAEPVDPRLYGYQNVGARFVAMHEWAMLLDDMGTGKTVQAIKAIELREKQGSEPYPALITCPNSMKRTWVKEFAHWYPEARVAQLDGSRAKKLKIIQQVKDGEVDVLVANWESLRHHSRLAGYGSVRLQGCKVCEPGEKREQRLCHKCPKELNEVPWRTIVADESHRAKDPNAQQTRALWALRTENTTLRVIATGTWTANGPQDAWAQLHFLDPKSFPGKTKFIDRYLLVTHNPFGGMEVTGLNPLTQAEFYSIIDPHMIRRTKAEVLPNLPKKVYSVREVEMAPKQQKAYDDMVASMVAELESGDHTVALDPIVQRTRLIQFASATGVDVVRTKYIDPKTGKEKTREKVILDEPSNKIDAVMEILDEAAGKPLVVFAVSTQLLNLLSKRMEKAKIPHGLITGQQSLIERNMHMEFFQEGKYPAILCQVQAGGTGITLTAADTVVFMQNTDSSVDRQQAEDRCHRKGSEIHYSINIIDVRSVGSMEAQQEWNLAMKQGRLQELLRDRERLLRLLKGK
jgi:SNF2 family DNA or RNA helicase